MRKAPSARQEILLRAILEQRVPLNFDVYLDELLIWLNTHSPDSELSRGLAQYGMDQPTAAWQVLNLLDRYLFAAEQAPHRVLGIAADADNSTVRLRYRRLVQAFHPDRQPDRKEWLTDRTERLNSAYSALKRKTPHSKKKAFQERKRRPSPAYDAGPSAAVPPVRLELPISTFLAIKLRAFLGAGRSFEKRFFGVLLGVCGLFLVLLYYHNAPVLEVSTPLTSLPVPIEQDTAGSGASEASVMSRLPQEPIQDSGGQKPANISPVGVNTNAHSAAEEQWVATEKSTSDSATLFAASGAKPSFYSLAMTDISAPLSEIALFADAPTAKLAAKTEDRPIDSTHLGTLAQDSPTLTSKLTHPIDVQAEKKQEQQMHNLTAIPVISARHPTPTQQPSETITASISAPEHVSSCAAHQDLLNRFVSFYNSGDAAGFAGLYSDYALENKLQGRVSIKTAYAKWFSSTRERELRLSRMSARPLDTDRCQVTGSYRVYYQEASGRRLTQNGRIELILERAAGSHRILRVNY